MGNLIRGALGGPIFLAIFLLRVALIILGVTVLVGSVLDRYLLKSLLFVSPDLLASEDTDAPS